MNNPKSSTAILASTTPSLEGWTITHYLGIASSHVVAGTGLFSDVFASFTDIFGGRSKTFQRHLAAIDAEAVSLLQHQAMQRGGNALVGLRVDHDELSGKNTQMLMCTAQATVVRVVRQRAGDDAAVLDLRRVDASAIADLSTRKDLLKNLGVAANVYPTTEAWKTIKTQRAPEFIPWIIERLAQPHTPDTPANFMEEALDFLGLFPEEVTRPALCAAVRTAPDPRRLLQVIGQLQLADLAVAQAMIAAPELDTAKRGLALLECHQSSYSPQDLAILEELVGLLPGRFPRIAPVVEDRGVFGKKERWHCPACKKANDATTEVCASCGCDVRGCLGHEPKVPDVVARLQNRIVLLRELLANA